MITALENPLSAVRAISQLERRAEAAGMYVFFKSDFGEFAEVRALARPGSRVSAMFDPRCSDDLSNGRRAFWLHCIDGDGRTVSLQAARVDLIDSSLAQWSMSWMSALYRMRGDDVEPARWRPMSNSMAEKISGRVVYHGEFWLAEDFRGSRAGSMLDVLPRMALLLAYIKWCPDHVWGVITDDLAVRGGGIRMGYTVQQPALLSWLVEPEGAGKSETMVACDTKDLAYLAELEAGRG